MLHVKFRGKDCYITDERVKKETRRAEYNYYEMRHDDDNDWATPVTIERGVLVNFCGTIVSKEDLLENVKYIELSDDESSFLSAALGGNTTGNTIDEDIEVWYPR